MSKELTPLEALEELRFRITHFNGEFTNYIELIGTIETALEKLKNTNNILKEYGLEDLFNLRETLEFAKKVNDDEKTVVVDKKAFIEQSKKLESFEIIKEKNVDVSGIKNAIKAAISNNVTLIKARTQEIIAPYIYYNVSRPKNERLTEDEFDLLKKELL